MGYRLHYAKTYHVDWQGGAFNHDTQEWSELFYAKFNDNGWITEDESQCEVWGEDMRKYIAELAKLKPKAKNEFFTEYTNEEVSQELTEIVEGCQDEYIRLEWF